MDTPGWPNRRNGDGLPSSNIDNLDELLREMPEILDAPGLSNNSLVDELNSMAAEERQRAFMTSPLGDNLDDAVGLFSNSLASMSPSPSIMNWATNPILAAFAAVDDSELGQPVPGSSFTFNENYFPYTPPEEELLHATINPTYSLVPDSDIGCTSPSSDERSSPYSSPSRSMDISTHHFEHNYATAVQSLRTPPPPPVSLNSVTDYQIPDENDQAGMEMVDPNLVFNSYRSHPPSTVLMERTNMNTIKSDTTKLLKARIKKSVERKTTRPPPKNPKKAAGSTHCPGETYQTAGKPKAYTERMRHNHIESLKKKAVPAKRKSARQDEGRRNIHNHMEKRRRIAMLNYFRVVSRKLPIFAGVPKPSKASVLDESRKYLELQAVEDKKFTQETKRLTLLRDQKLSRLKELIESLSSGERELYLNSIIGR